MALLGADGKTATPEKGNPAGPIPVSWAFIVAVDTRGIPHFIDHEDAHTVHALRRVTIDDIYAACAVATGYEILGQIEETYGVAFVVFCTTDGHIAASPDIFELISPFSYPSMHNIKGAVSVIQGQIIAQKAADMAAPLAAQATLSVLSQIESQKQFSKASSLITASRNG